MSTADYAELRQEIRECALSKMDFSKELEDSEVVALIDKVIEEY